MPTTNKRINLTVPDVLYKKIQAYKDENGILSDASACIQLISAQLRGLETTKQMLDAMKQLTPEQLKALANYGIDDYISHGNQFVDD